MSASRNRETLSSSLTRMQFVLKHHTLFYARTAAVLDGSQLSKSHRSGDVAALFISIGRMPFLVPILDNTEPLFALVIASSFYLHHVEVAD